MKFLLFESVKRTIVWEFNQNRLKNSKLTFPKYLRKLRSKNQISFLFKKYPVLKEIINNAIKNYSLSFKLLLSRLVADMQELCFLFNLSPSSSLKDIRFYGDLHCNGNRIAILSFKLNNKIIKFLVYKHRDIAMEAKYNKFLRFLKALNNILRCLE